jgi:multidrug efflux pump subunit AcrA (membrane-fusion protein)
MKRRKIIIIIAGVLILAGAIILAVSLSPKNEGNARMNDFGGVNAAVVVDAEKIQNSSVKTFVNLTGRLKPEDKIDIYSEVNGVLQETGKAFKEGVYYRRGEVLLRMNADEARQNLLAQRNNFINTLATVIPDLKIDFPEIFTAWRDYLLKLDPEDPLPPLPEVRSDQQKLFLTGRNVYSQYHNIQQLEDRLDKYVVRAPFSGVITEVNINVGTLVRSMQKIGEFMSTGVFELEAAVGINEISYVNTGDTVALKSTATGKNYSGVVSRINAKVDEGTQTIKIFIRLSGSDLKAGMYMSGSLLAEIYHNASRIQREALLEPDRIFIIEDSIASLENIEVLKLTEQEAVIRGLEDNDLIITGSRNASFEGTKVSWTEELED